MEWDAAEQGRSLLPSTKPDDDDAPQLIDDLRRAVAAPNVGRETVPATTGSADEPAKPGGEPAAQRFMLHLLAENLDYVLEALGPVS